MDLERVIHTFVTSGLDYCNSLYVGLDQSSIKHLNLVQMLLLTSWLKKKIETISTGFLFNTGLILKFYC